MQTSSEFDAGDGGVGSIGLGYQFNPQFRLEARISYHDTDYSESGGSWLMR
ncbi:hypothetical protein ACOBV8_19095 (plasmid) [Pseudoalteromonas espejiana]